MTKPTGTSNEPEPGNQSPMKTRPFTASALESYLQDHFIGAETGCALADRAARSHASRPSGALLSRLSADLEDDRRALLATMTELGSSPRPLSRAAGRMGEVVSRLKRFEWMGGHTAFSRLQELEMLLIGSRGRQGLWAALRAHFGEVALAQEMAFGEREVRAQRHCEALDEARVEAAREAFAGDAGDGSQAPGRSVQA